MIARVVTYLVIALLALFVFSTTFVLDHGGGGATPAGVGGHVSIHDLSLVPDTYRGKTVITEGTLGFSSEVKQHQIVDPDPVDPSKSQAVVVLGYDALALRALEGQRVSVTGRFDFDPATGIFIDADIVAGAE